MTRVYVSAVMPISLEQAWRVLRDFNGLPDYHPFFAKSYIEDGKPADQVGCVRHFHDHNGNAIREELLSLSDREHLCCYRILEAPALPVRGYVSEMRLKPITTSGHCFGEWWAEFEVDDADHDDVVQRVSDTFRLAFEGAAERARPRRTALCRLCRGAGHGQLRRAGYAAGRLPPAPAL